MVAAEIDAWLARLRHDLVKRLVWPARDRRDAGGAPAPGELLAALVDDEGRPAGALEIWGVLAAAALPRALAAARAGDVAGVLELEPAFDRLAALARSLDGGS